MVTGFDHDTTLVRICSAWTASDALQANFTHLDGRKCEVVE